MSRSYAWDHSGRATSPATSSNLSTNRVFPSGRVPDASTPLRRGHCSSQHVPRDLVDIGVDIVWTSPARKKRPTDFPRKVKVGAAEGDTCGPRALTVRSRSQTQWTRPDPSGRPGSASVFPPTRQVDKGESLGGGPTAAWGSRRIRDATVWLELWTSSGRVRVFFAVRCRYRWGGGRRSREGRHCGQERLLRD